MSMASPSKSFAAVERRPTFGLFGNACSTTASVTGPGSPPQVSIINCVARSIARRCNIKSTPRSKRWDASVCIPNCRARPATASGVKKALSRKTCRVLSLTADSRPPITPAIASARSVSAITRVSAGITRDSPSSRVISSPAAA